MQVAFVYQAVGDGVTHAAFYAAYPYRRLQAIDAACLSPNLAYLLEEPGTDLLSHVDSKGLTVLLVKLGQTGMSRLVQSVYKQCCPDGLGSRFFDLAHPYGPRGLESWARIVGLLGHWWHLLYFTRQSMESHYEGMILLERATAALALAKAGVHLSSCEGRPLLAWEWAHTCPRPNPVLIEVVA